MKHLLSIEKILPYIVQNKGFNQDTIYLDCIEKYSLYGTTEKGWVYSSVSLLAVLNTMFRYFTSGNGVLNIFSKYLWKNPWHTPLSKYLKILRNILFDL